MVHKGIGATSSSTQPPLITTTPPPIHTPTMAGNPPARPWANLGAVNMRAPLSKLLDHLDKWLSRFNPDNGLSAEEHINNFMFSINLNRVTKEDAIIISFSYNLQGEVGSWYFLLPSGSIKS